MTEIEVSKIIHEMAIANRNRVLSFAEWVIKEECAFYDSTFMGNLYTRKGRKDAQLMRDIYAEYCEQFYAEADILKRR